MSDGAVVVKTRKFKKNPLLARRQVCVLVYVSLCVDVCAFVHMAGCVHGVDEQHTPTMT